MSFGRKIKEKRHGAGFAVAFELIFHLRESIVTADPVVPEALSSTWGTP